ncbi:MAG: hypothetical protein LBU81_04470 [Methanosarcinales archaeon]|jgi:hypothetical protein|nr:hypothetical protein [Methanosarcinales archaeon]
MLKLKNLSSLVLVLVIFLIFSVVSLCLLFAAVHINSDEADSGVILTINNITPFHISYTLENPTSNDYLTSACLSLLYMFKNDSWIRVEEINITVCGLVGVPLSSHSKLDLTSDWQAVYGELPAGDYKIQKEISLSSDYRDKYVLEQEFSLP